MSHLPVCRKALSSHFRPPLPILVARDLREGGLTSRGSFPPLLGLRSGPAAGCPTLRMCYLSARSPSPSQAPSTPPPASPRPSVLLPPHLPARSRGPQVRKTAKFHAPRTPASSCDKKGRRGRAELPGRCVRCVRPLVALSGLAGPPTGRASLQRCGEHSVLHWGHLL